jgi:hypothetical protein
MRQMLGAGLMGFTLAALLLGFPSPEQAADNKEETIHIFNGKDLTNFYTYLGAPKSGAKPYGKNNDPEKVFTVHDGMIHVSGKVYGGLITEKEYENYHLIVDFKWGKQTWPPRKDRARDSGVLVHCVGADGAYGRGREQTEPDGRGRKTRRAILLQGGRNPGDDEYRPL